MNVSYFSKLSNIFVQLLLIFTVSATIACSQKKQTKPQTERPKTTKAKVAEKKYLYYLHGRIIEDLGVDNSVSERFGKYEYKEILKAFEEKGFEVISEARPQNTDVKQYAKKIADEIKLKLKAENSQENITVVGASKGSLIAMLISTELGFENINYVLMGNCNIWVKDNFDINLHGRILSIYEKSDTVGGNSCEEIKAVSKGVSEFKEIQIDTNLDHGFLYKPLKEWVEPTIEWAKK